ncbi:Flp pilus assembly complex ATPase component TadA [Candidatus Peribacteria bacterium]|jgi:type IV pilus assembly protein PilB|nr:Flp pilus assembly complex ATPase component TadA [Candidatus Peribacteria bacterium]MBT4021709.1 Flp pilus assembly complex ATPase component TadA [Candidatus Peribacteria bacterium]MBT4241172.1 Flp pilus assembly complex ATPase component TadA [Candidatus Peribacteria bacterium]MBT4473925.1 Flp pilus assembly complex ATPase component TadA [Candidatus Peribacteria bacterium]
MKTNKQSTAEHVIDKNKALAEQEAKVVNELVERTLTEHLTIPADTKNNHKKKMSKAKKRVLKMQIKNAIERDMRKKKQKEHEHSLKNKYEELLSKKGNININRDSALLPKLQNFLNRKLDSRKQAKELKRMIRERKVEEKKLEKQTAILEREENRKHKVEEKKSEKQRAILEKEENKIREKAERKRLEAEKKRRVEEKKRLIEQEKKNREIAKIKARDEIAKRKEQKIAQKEALKRAKAELKEQRRQSNAERKAALMAQKEAGKQARLAAKIEREKRKTQASISPRGKTKALTAEAIEDEAKEEAMKQVLIEKEVAKLRHETQSERKEVAASAANLESKNQELAGQLQNFESEKQSFIAEKKKWEEERKQTSTSESQNSSISISPEESKILEAKKITFENEKQKWDEDRKKWEKANTSGKPIPSVSTEELERAKTEAYAQAKAEFDAKPPTVITQAAPAGAIPVASPEESKNITAERTLLENDKKQFEIERRQWEANKSTPAPVVQTVQTEIKGTLSEKDAKKMQEEAYKKAKIEFEAQQSIMKDEVGKLQSELEQWKHDKPEQGKSGMQAVEEERKKIEAERAGIETERALMKEQARKDAYSEFEEERTKFEIEKEKVKQKALAEAEANILSNMKSRSLFGGKQKAALNKEIDRWKKEAEKVEKQRLELERMRALQSEHSRLQSSKQDIEESKVKLERERVAQERESLKEKEDHEKKIGLERERLEEERQKLETEKREKLEGKERREEDKKDKNKNKNKDKNKNTEEKRSETEIKEMDVGKILVAQNYLEDEELETAKKEASIRNTSVENILKEEGLVTPQLIQNAVAEYYQMPFVDLSSQPPDSEIIELLPEEIAISLHTIALAKEEDGSIRVATSNPEMAEDIKASIKKIHKEAPKIHVVYASKGAIESAFSFYRKPLDTRFRKIIEQHRKIAPEIIEEIFADAIQLGASDVHFEPQEKIVVVRFRVDGVMHEAGRIPKEYYEGIVNRIKIAGNMRIDEHFAAQDGAIRWKGGGRAMDVRVSIVPIVDGEKIVMRLLSEYVRTLTLSDLGFTDKQLNVLVKAAHKPFGMILTTGPTGSGKSTTLYGLMKIRNSPDVNISTIEDPVEYKIPGINHIQVNTKANLTFERGLRALVRQDPDIILVGEIRDNITAQISVNAALTGHLLFSTLHANDAATAIPRLLEMGIEPFLLASTLELLIAQRLMRRTCSHCRYSYNVAQSEAEQLFPYAEHYFKDEDIITLYKGKGCGACGNTGYKGRVGVYELLVVTPELEELITERRTSGEINNLARAQGMLTLFEDGLQKAKTGLSTVEELLRISAPPEPLPDTHSIKKDSEDIIDVKEENPPEETDELPTDK